MIAIYARQSIDKGEASLSIETQIDKCKQYLSLKGLKQKNERIKVFEEEGFSGKNTQALVNALVGRKVVKKWYFSMFLNVF